MGNAGEARLDVIALGRDEVTAVMNKVSGELDQMKAKLAAYERGQRATGEATKAVTKATGEAATGLEAIKDKFKGLDAGRAVFEKINGNLLAWPAAIAGAVGGLLSVVKAFGDAGSASEALRVKATEYADAIKGARRDLEELRKLAGKEVPDTLSPVGIEAGMRFGEVSEKVLHLETRLRELKDIDALGETMSDLNAMMIGLGSADRRYLEIARTQNELRDLTALRRDLERETTWEVTRQADEMARVAREARAVVDAQWSAAIDRATGPVKDPFVDAIPGEKPKPPKPPPKPPRPPKPPEEEADPFEGKEHLRGGEKSREGGIKDHDWRALEKTIQEASGNADLYRAGNKGGKADGSFEKHKKEVDELTESYRRWASVLSSELAPILPGIGDAISDMGELFAELEQINDVNDRANRAVSGSIKAGLDLAAANAKTAREAYIYKGLGAAAEAIGAYARYDYAAGAMYTAQAAAFGVAAAAAGGGGGGAGGGARHFSGAGQGTWSRDAGGGGGGPRVLNVNTLVADKQSVSRAVQEAEYATRGTGYARRGGA